MREIETVYRIEKHVIKKKHSHFAMLEDYCHRAKNLYNKTNYEIRQEFTKSGKVLSFFTLCKFMKTGEREEVYRAMPSARSANGTIELVSNAWTSFLKARKDYFKHPEKYKRCPRIPGFLEKDGMHILNLTKDSCTLKEGYICFPKVFEGLKLKTNITSKPQVVRILPRNKHFVVEVVYKIEVPDKVEDNGRYFSIDIGLDNLATVTSNTGMRPVIINGKGLKSINKYYNKQLAYYKSIAKQMNGVFSTNKLNKLSYKRNNKVKDYLHKASKYIIDLAVENNISTIVVGNNKGWKQESKLSKKVNQTFVGLPHQIFIDMLTYKGEDVGISVITTEESYTSGTSFLDNEEPVKENYNKKRRKHRGLFISNEGVKINADVNASYQILKKVFPKAYVEYGEGIEGVVLHPIVVNAA